MKKGKKDKSRIIGIVLVAIVVAVIAYFFVSSETMKPGELPSYVSGEVRAMYEWSKTPEGAALLEKIPCYCGCKYDGHKNAKNCFWRDDGTFDKHGMTCSVCHDIAKKAKLMNEEGKGVCKIRYEIDKFYASNRHLGTDTALPEGCTAYQATGDEPALPEGCGNADGDGVSCPV